MAVSTLLVGRSLATLRQVEDALARQALYGGDLLTNLLEVAPPPATDEQELSRVLAEHLGLEAATRAKLATPQPDALFRVPRAIAETYRVVPLEVAGDTLVLASDDALSPAVIETLRRSVGPLRVTYAIWARVQQALEKLYGLPMDRRARKLCALLDEGGPPRLSSPAPTRAAGSAKPPSAAAALLSSRPARTSQPVPTVDTRVADDLRRRREQLERHLEEVTGKEQILDGVLDFAQQFFTYTALFLVHDDVAEGWGSRGQGAPTDEVRRLAVPLELPSLFSLARSQRLPVIRPRPRPLTGERAVDDVVAQDLELRLHQGDVAVVPLLIGKRVVALLFGDADGAKVALATIADVVQVAAFAGSALARVILQRKRGASGAAGPAESPSREAPARVGDVGVSTSSAPVAAAPMPSSASAPSAPSATPEHRVENSVPASTKTPERPVPTVVEALPNTSAPVTKAGADVVAEPAAASADRAAIGVSVADEQNAWAEPAPPAKVDLTYPAPPPGVSLGPSPESESALPRAESTRATGALTEQAPAPSADAPTVSSGAPTIPDLADDWVIPSSSRDAMRPPPMGDDASAEPVTFDSAGNSGTDLAFENKECGVAALSDLEREPTDTFALPPEPEPGKALSSAPPRPPIASVARAAPRPPTPSVAVKGRVAPPLASVVSRRPVGPPIPREEPESFGAIEVARPIPPQPRPTYQPAAGVGAEGTSSAAPGRPAAATAGGAHSTPSRGRTTPPSAGSSEGAAPSFAPGRLAPAKASDPEAPEPAARTRSLPPMAAGSIGAVAASPRARTLPPTASADVGASAPPRARTLPPTASADVGPVTAPPRIRTIPPRAAGGVGTAPVVAVNPTLASLTPPVADDQDAGSEGRNSGIDLEADEIVEIEASEMSDRDLRRVLAIARESERFESHSPKPPPAPLPPSKETFLPKVIVAVEPEYVVLVERAMVGGDVANRALAELYDLGVAALPAIMDRFPGPTRCDRTTAFEQIPPPHAVGPLIALLAKLSRLAIHDVLARTTDSSPETRFWAVYLLTHVVARESAGPLIPRLVDDDLAVRRAAYSAARRLIRSVPQTAHSLADPLVSWVIDGSASLPLRVRAAVALGELRDRRVVRGLIAGVAVREEEVAAACQDALTLVVRQDPDRRGTTWPEWYRRHGQRSRIEWLIDALMEEDLALRDAAASELKELTDVHFGYYATQPRGEREAAWRRYLTWWTEEGHSRFPNS